MNENEKLERNEQADDTGTNVFDINEASAPKGTTEFDLPAKPEEEKKEETANGEPEKKPKAKKQVNHKKIAKMGIAYPLQVLLYGLYKVATWLINILLTVFLVGIISFAAVCVAFVIYIKGNVDPNYTGLDNLQFESSLYTTISYVDDNGEEVEFDRLVGSENRAWASYEEMPADLIDAFLAIEDKRYWEHPGIDYRRTINAVLGFFGSGDRSGGSTITQQLIKNVSKEDDVTIQRKVQEILRALNVTKKYSKEEILEMYLNTIFLSQNCYGVKTAAQEYFGKELKDLTLIECAALASIPKSPTKYDPVRNPLHNQERRDLVLEEMLKQGRITQEEFDSCYRGHLELNTEAEAEDYSETIHSYFVDALIDEVIDDLIEEHGYDRMTAARLLYSGGLQIITTMDPMVQDAMESVFEKSGNEYLYLGSETVAPTKGVIPQAAMVIMNQKTGDILGIVGGRGEKKEGRGFNRATQSRRQCGSSIKPLSLYTLAIEEGLITAGSAVDDVPTLKNDDEYWPTNTPNVYYGMIDTNFAVIKSLNTIPVALVDKLTPEKCFNFLTETLGFESIIRREEIGGKIYSDIALAPLALGGFTHGVTVREMTQGYCMIANGGKTSEGRMYTEVRDRRESILLQKEQVHKVAVSESSAYSMTSMLMNVVSQVGGTGTRVTLDSAFEMEVAGKTGSTNDDRDRYFVAFTPNYVGGVWFGYDNNKSLSGFTGNPALSLWDRVFTIIYENLEEDGVSYQKQFDIPTGMVKVKYCAISGKVATDACYRDIYYYDNAKNSFTGNAVMTGVFAAGTQPIEKCDCHIEVLYDRETQAICFEGCACPEEDLITVSFRLNNERVFDSFVFVMDGDCIYKDIPEGYVFPESKAQPFFANLYTEEDKTYYFGTLVGGRPRNRICIEHYHAEEAPPETSEEVSADVEE